MILIVSSWSPPAMGKDEILYRALALLIGRDNNLAQSKQREALWGPRVEPCWPVEWWRAWRAGGHGARAVAPIIKVGVLTDLSGPYRDINGPHDEPA